MNIKTIFVLIGLSLISIQCLRIELQNKSQKPLEKIKQQHDRQFKQTQSQKFKKHFFRKQIEENDMEAIQSKILEMKLFSSDFSNSYEGYIELGENKTKLSALFDTGSSVIWFASESCEQCTKSGIKSLYNCNQSDTCIQTKKKDGIKYGKGQCSGTVIQDSMTINGATTIKNQDVLLVDKIKDFPNYPGDGLIGLGSEKLTNGETTFMQNLYEQKLIKQNLFAMVLQTQNRQSYLDIGELNPQLYQGHIYYFPILNNGYWAIQMTKLFMKTQENGVLSIERNQDPNYWQLKAGALVIDSGTSILTFPSSDIQALIQMLNQLKFNCSYDSKKYQQILCDVPQQGYSAFPELGVSAVADSGQNINIIIDPSQYVICDQTFLFKCVVRISKLDIANIAIFGDIFMSSFYSIFDIEQQRIGFAQLSSNIDEINENINDQEFSNEIFIKIK